MKLMRLFAWMRRWEQRLRSVEGEVCEVRNRQLVLEQQCLRTRSPWDDEPVELRAVAGNAIPFPPCRPSQRARAPTCLTDVTFHQVRNMVRARDPEGAKTLAARAVAQSAGGRSYSIAWLIGLLQHRPVEKLGIAAFVAVLAHASHAFPVAFWFVVFAWSIDMLLGNLRAWLDKSVRWVWSKNLNGAVRLVVIALMGIILAIVEGFIDTVLGISGIEGKLVVAGYTLAFLGELRSIGVHLPFFIRGAGAIVGKARELLEVLGGVRTDDEEEEDA